MTHAWEDTSPGPLPGTSSAPGSHNLEGISVPLLMIGKLCGSGWLQSLSGMHAMQQTKLRLDWPSH